MSYSAPFATLGVDVPAWHKGPPRWEPGKRFSRSVSDITLNGPVFKDFTAHDGNLELDRHNFERLMIRATGATGRWDRPPSTSPGMDEARRRGLPKTPSDMPRERRPGMALASLFKDREARVNEWSSAAPPRSGAPKSHGPGAPFATTWNSPLLSTTISTTGSHLARTGANRFGPKAFFVPPPMTVPLQH
mmetsp:Transcript_68814/g.199649  ORF Transcript_68814/g.199649 Transcript_68814/m.199649 type:complete len:190 (-) Transcript_68814:65-634(-)